MTKRQLKLQELQQIYVNACAAYGNNVASKEGLHLDMVDAKIALELAHHSAQEEQVAQAAMNEVTEALNVSSDS